MCIRVIRAFASSSISRVRAPASACTRSTSFRRSAAATRAPHPPPTPPAGAPPSPAAARPPPPPDRASSRRGAISRSRSSCSRREVAPDVGPLPIALLLEHRDLALALLDLHLPSAAHLRPIQLLFLRDEGDLPVALLLLPKAPALDLRPVQLPSLAARAISRSRSSRSRARARRISGRLAPLGVFEEGDRLRDLRLLGLLRGADLLALHLQAAAPG